MPVHGGILFLDEMGEFPASVLDALRQPLEDGVVRVSRARGTTTFPARFILVGAMNPCPCGEGGSPGACRCTGAARERYARRLSGPLIDRFDMAVRVDRPGAEELLTEARPESTSTISCRVAAARRLALARSGCINGEIPARGLDRVVPLTPKAAALLEGRVRSGALSARGLDRARRLARTIADLDAVGRRAEGGEQATHIVVTEDGGGGRDQRAEELGVEVIQRALLLRCQREYLLGDWR